MLAKGSHILKVCGIYYTRYVIRKSRCVSVVEHLEIIAKRRGVEVEVEEVSEEISDFPEAEEEPEFENRFSESTRRYTKTSAGIVGMIGDHLSGFQALDQI